MLSPVLQPGHTWTVCAGAGTPVILHAVLARHRPANQVTSYTCPLPSHTKKAYAKRWSVIVMLDASHCCRPLLPLLRTAKHRRAPSLLGCQLPQRLSTPWMQHGSRAPWCCIMLARKGCAAACSRILQQPGWWRYAASCSCCCSEWGRSASRFECVAEPVQALKQALALDG